MQARHKDDTIAAAPRKDACRTLTLSRNRRDEQLRKKGCIPPPRPPRLRVMLSPEMSRGAAESAEGDIAGEV